MMKLFAGFRKGGAADKGSQAGLVVTHLIGGLGNQFFQYAFGRALALRYGATLKLDISDFKSYPLRPFELDKYPIEASIATEDDLISFGICEKNGGRHVTSPRRNYRRYQERHFRFDAAVYELRTHGLSQLCQPDCQRRLSDPGRQPDHPGRHLPNQQHQQRHGRQGNGHRRPNPGGR